MPRERMERDEPAKKPSFFATRSGSLEFINSGCELLNCAIGGGWVLGRVANVVGDKSTGKSLLAIEGCANFARDYKDGAILYRESEHAFDQDYANALGMPLDRVDFLQGEKFRTIENLFDDLNDQLKILKRSKDPGLYICDSLDGLSDEAELKREITDGSYGMNKQKKLGELFRKLSGDLESTRCCLMIISQIREDIDARFGKKYRRSGGKALDFYASQVLWLAKIKTLHRQVAKIERATGVRIKAKVEKLKVGLPFRDCEFDIQFGFGIDDVGASVKWLQDSERTDLLGGISPKKFLEQLEKMEGSDYRDGVDDLNGAVRKAWQEIEVSFLPVRKKYG